MIRLENISKDFKTDNRKVKAVKDVSINIDQGEIYGIIGYSGAGKSTLLRTINLLERPTRGSVYFKDEDITSLEGDRLREYRKNIGMIFQNFNLFNSRTVYENIAFPLKNDGLSKKEEEKRVVELLKLVELKDKTYAYPSQLSGGEKQRVAIARALANNPELILCDEATSSLDPRTRKSILKLLKNLNEELGITIVLITHEMEVVKEICSRVAIMADGSIIEENNVLEIFLEPKNEETKEFLQMRNDDEKVKEFLELENNILELNRNERLAKITYVGSNTSKALISKVSRKFGIDIIILHGKVDILDNTPVGQLIICFKGEEDKIDLAIDYFKEKDLRLEVI